MEESKVKYCPDCRKWGHEIVMEEPEEGLFACKQCYWTEGED